MCVIQCHIATKQRSKTHMQEAPFDADPTRCRQANTQQVCRQAAHSDAQWGGCQTHSAAAEGSFGFLMSFLPPRGAALAVSVAAAPDALGAWPQTSAASHSSVRSAGSLISMLLSTRTPKVSCSPSSMLDLEEACSILPRTGASSGQQKTKRIWHAHGCACSAWCVRGGVLCVIDGAAAGYERGSWAQPGQGWAAALMHRGTGSRGQGGGKADLGLCTPAEQAVARLA